MSRAVFLFLSVLLCISLNSGCSRDQTQVQTAQDQAEIPEKVPSDSDSLHIVGATSSEILFLDTGSRPWQVERFKIGNELGGERVKSIIFLGKRDKAAIRAKNKVGMWSREGELLWSTVLGAASSMVEYGTDPEMEQIVEDYGPGEYGGYADAIFHDSLLRTASGRLALRFGIDMGRVYGEEEGCTQFLESTAELDVTNVDLSMDSSYLPPEGRSLNLNIPNQYREEPLPEGWQCFAWTLGDEISSERPPWVADDPVEFVANLPFSDVECPGFAHSDSQETPFERCFGSAPGFERRGAGICRYSSNPLLFVTLSFPDQMGCIPGPIMIVVDGEDVVARPGFNSTVIVYDDVWIFGGHAEWFVAGPDERPLSFGTIRPSVM